MMDKMESQLELARRIRAVDQRDVAERVIKTHFLPDMIWQSPRILTPEGAMREMQLQGATASH